MKINKFNLVNPTKALKGIESENKEEKVITPRFYLKNDESKEEVTKYSYHNIHGESVSDSKGNLVPPKTKKNLIQLIMARLPK